jgi:hypothetical protein
MARVPDEELQRIKSQVNVEDLCRDYGIELQRMGPDNLMGRCPFHDDHTPSFGVTPSKNLWNCLAGCGGGDVIELVVRKQNVSVIFPILDEHGNVAQMYARKITRALRQGTPLHLYLPGEHRTAG